MIERGQHLGFALESRQPLSIAGDRVGENLDRHGALQIGVRGAVDLAHATDADLRRHFVRAEAGARSESQVEWIISRQSREGGSP